MVEDISNPFFASIARLIEDRACKNGYKIIYCSTDNDTGKTQDLVNMFRDRHVDGYIIAPPEGIEDDLNSSIKNGMPVVMFDRHLPKVDTDYVEIDNLFSTYNATLHLIEQGYKNIA
ncbi:MAG: LacI family transcriptional regulator, partial [Mucilaginibacter sp.]